MQSGQGHIIIPVTSKNLSSKLFIALALNLTQKLIKIKIYTFQDYSYQYLNLDNNNKGKIIWTWIKEIISTVEDQKENEFGITMAVALSITGIIFITPLIFTMVDKIPLLWKDKSSQGTSIIFHFFKYWKCENLIFHYKLSFEFIKQTSAWSFCVRAPLWEFWVMYIG